MLNEVVSSVPIEVLTVKQDRGQDSTVQVFEEVRVSWPQDIKVLRFVSDQSLNVNSDRAWNVHKAIDNYAKPLGFDTNRVKPDKNELTASYNPTFHSHMAEFQLREQVKTDARYQAKRDANAEQQNIINRQYGIAIRQLKNLITELERRNHQELDALNQELIDTQIEILQGLDIPEVLTEQHKRFLLEPNYPIDQVKMDAYAEYGQRGKLPTDLNSILSLLN